MEPEFVDRLIRTIRDELTPQLQGEALSRLVVEFGTELGHFDQAEISYLPRLANLTQMDSTVSPTLGIVAAIAIGFGVETRQCEQHVAGIDESEGIGEAIGVALAELNPFAAREAVVKLQGRPKEVARLLIRSCSSGIESRACELLTGDLARDKEQAVRIAASLALLVAPLSPDMLVRQIWGGYGDSEADVKNLLGILEICKQSRLITDDGDDIRRMYKSPIPDGMIALTYDGRKTIASRYRQRRRRRVLITS